MVTSLFIMVIGAAAVHPGGGDGQLPVLSDRQLCAGQGVCVLQTSANPYVSILGPESTARLV